MRTGVFETNKSITYPDDISFCFNPMLVRVQTNNAVTCIISNGGMSFTDRRTSYEGSVEIDVSVYTQMFFSFGGMDLIYSKMVTVLVQTEKDSFSFTTEVIWGALNIGEVFNRSRNIMWFKNFPFTVSMYIASGAIMRKRYDRNKYQSFNPGSGLVHLDPSALFGNAVDFGVIRLDEMIPESTFDYTFDNTFRPVGDGVIINRLVVDDSECGIYLRWIDRHGFYQHWLFSKGQDDMKSNQYGEQLYQDYEVGGRGYYGVSRMQGMEVANTMRICASLVDRDYYSMIRTIIGSPMVDMYQDGVWIPVRIDNSTVSDEGKSLQDIEFSIVLPDIITQKL